jgi:hypothetical protein
VRVAKGRFKEKHPPEAIADPEIAQAVIQKILDGNVTCADAAAIASELHKSMQETGVALDILEISLTSCQLGLFGYSPQKNIVIPAKSVEKDIETAITQRLLNGCLSCDAAWEISKALTLPKIKVSSACEAMKIKIKPCQLGAF